MRGAPWEKCPLSEVPLGRSAPWAKCPLGEVPLGRSAPWAKCPLGEVPLDTTAVLRYLILVLCSCARFRVPGYVPDVRFFACGRPVGNEVRLPC